MPGEQREFNFNRAAQLRILEQAEIQSRGPAKPVLKALDSYARESHESFPSTREIARNVGCSIKTARRALHELEELGLVVITPRLRPNGSHASNSYVVNWIKLMELSPVSSIVSDEGGTPTVTGGYSHGDRGVLPPWESHPKRPLKRISKPHERDEKKTSEEKARRTADLGYSAHCWGKQLSRAHLTDPSSVQLLFRFAIAKNWVADSEMSRLAFFGLAHYCSQKGKSPGAYFTDSLRKRRFNLVGADDEEWARRVIRGIDAPAACSDFSATHEQAMRYLEEAGL